MKIIFILMMIELVMILQCSSPTSPEFPEEKTLAIVGNRIITLNEFLKRAEYAIRPTYCKNNGPVEKKIILNNLIAEKMIAQEIEDTASILENEKFKHYIQGRKEQLMRKILYYEEGINKANAPDSLIKKNYELARREYEFSYVYIDKKNFIPNANQISTTEFNRFAKEAGYTDSIPTQKTTYFEQKDAKLHKALYSTKLEKDQVLTPIPIAEKHLMLIKINGWTTRPAITEKQQRQQWNDVKEALIKEKAGKLYESFVSKVMKGKELNFYDQTFYKLVELTGDLYFKNRNSQREQFRNTIFDEDSSKKEITQIQQSIYDLKNENFFQVDDSVWTVGDFLLELEKHPLAYRDPKMQKPQFAEQFKLAVVDMVRDRYLNEEAKKRGYQELAQVKQEVSMWQDAIVSLRFQRTRVSRSSEPLNEIQYAQFPAKSIDSLQIKYSSKIFIDVDLFNSIKLSSIDMIAREKNVPYPIIVPPFPQFTVDHKLDYGEKLIPSDKKQNMISK